jgi:hypothetical protein
MKMFFSFMFFIALTNCYGATGYAYDGILFIGAVITFMLLLLAAGYLIDFLKARIKEARTKKWLKRERESEIDIKNYDELCLSQTS